MALKGKVALVTGSTSGIGLGIAQAFAKAGANVVLNGFGDPLEIEAIRSSIERDYSVIAKFFGADVSKPAEIRAMVAFVEKELGHLDILINNAGIQHVSPIEEFPDERWDTILAINLSSAFHSTKAALPGMRKLGWGRIINIASVHGLVASANKAAYVTAKHGVVGLTKVIGLETAGSGITCNAICPGWVLTPLVQAQIDALAKQKNLSIDQARAELLGAKQPSKQFATTEQIGSLALFLTSEAASQMTGGAITIDGGWSAQ